MRTEKTFYGGGATSISDGIFLLTDILAHNVQLHSKRKTESDDTWMMLDLHKKKEIEVLTEPELMSCRRQCGETPHQRWSQSKHQSGAKTAP